ncbi:MAG: GtrA family protein [Lachnospiraceae bacterium]|nr:GtrA family protein [Lachnospiraceae bacterium]
MKELYKKHKEIILYVFFGGLTTVINFLIAFVIQKGFGLSGKGTEFAVTNTIAWFGAVAFAYITSHIFVFESKAKGTKAIAAEAFKFVGSRIFTGIIEMLLPSGLVAIGIDGDFLSFEGFWAKAITGIIVIILNYVLSKLFVFRKKAQEQVPAGEEQAENV